LRTFSKPSEIKAAVIGYGGAFNMGRSHLREMQAAGMTPTAVAEIDPSRLESAKQDFPKIETYPDVATLLAKSEANIITIITPHNTHAPLALQCLEAGRHVVVEKPFAITTAECDAIIAAAKRAGTVVSTYHNRHWDGCILRAVDQIKNHKVIGDVFRIDLKMGRRGNPGDWWRASRTISGGILYDWGVHLLEYAFQLIDSTAIEVSGFAHTGFWAPHTKWKEDTIEDEAAAVIRFANGAWINLCISHLNAIPDPVWLLARGTLGIYNITETGYEVHTDDDGVHTVVKGRNPDSEAHRFYENIVAHLTKGEPLIITPEWARRPIHLLELAVESAKAGRSLPAQDHWVFQ
jgi:predicted dehydrogenase